MNRLVRLLAALFFSLGIALSSSVLFAQDKAQEKASENTEVSAPESTSSEAAQTPADPAAAAETAPSGPTGNSEPVALPPEKSDTLTDEVRAIRDAINIHWYKPQAFPNTEKKNVRISLAGQAKQGTRIYLKSNEIKVLKTPTNIYAKRLTKNDVKFLPSLTDQRGVFAFEMILPPGNYQVAVAAVDPEAQSMNAAKVYVLLLNVTMKGVDFGFVEEGSDLPFTPQSDFYSFGLGFNYTVFNKEVPSVPSEIRFSSFKIPALRLGYAKTWNPSWRIHASLIAAPGETTTGTRIPVEKGTYLWTILSLDAIYSREPWKFEWGNLKGRYGVRGGMQMHSVPFLRSMSAADNTQAVENINYMTSVIGAHVDLMTDYGITYEAYMRVGLPLITQSNLAMTESLSFDGSVGGRYRPKNSNWSYGLFWYGQWLKYKFTETDKFIGADVNGSSDILNSNIEFRLHYHY